MARFIHNTVKMMTVESYTFYRMLLLQILQLFLSQSFISCPKTWKSTLYTIRCHLMGVGWEIDLPPSIGLEIFTLCLLRPQAYEIIIMHRCPLS